MEILPSNYKQLELSPEEKKFAYYALSAEDYGYLIMQTNPIMLSKDSFHILLTTEGVVVYKFFNLTKEMFEPMMTVHMEQIHGQYAILLLKKLQGNKTLLDKEGSLKVAINIVYVFPQINYEDIRRNHYSPQLENFIRQNCLFDDQLRQLRNGFATIAAKPYLNYSLAPISKERLFIDDKSANAVLQRLCPEYVTIRVASLVDENTGAGADGQKLVVTEDDQAVRAFRLDAEQIDIVNKIQKGEQLILACAGSGKSVLLISKCFKAAIMNPNKKFLITCYNKNLQSLYEWFIDKAGLHAKNVECITFHKLCRELLQNSKIDAPSKPDECAAKTINCFNQGKIKQRYYGIFIDEVQQFNVEWYKLCFNLLENRETSDHIFVICGDKSQKLANLQKHGRAPWNTHEEGYPTYRGNKSLKITIEKNYRNCIEINEFINNFVYHAKRYIRSLYPDYAFLDEDEFLRGQSVFHGIGVTTTRITRNCNREEANTVIRAICKIHDEMDIPYDEIAIIMCHKTLRHKMSSWSDRYYDIETPLISALEEADIPFCRMYKNDDIVARYHNAYGVKVITVQSVLGLDFRACVVCGLKAMGEYDHTKLISANAITEENVDDITINTHNNIRELYVACTRAKEFLNIILPESSKESKYIELIEKSL